jgi:putative ABC transport system permease protein
MRILQGRDFHLEDAADRPRVAIVSAKLARLLPGSGPVIGRSVKIGQEKGEWRIIGISSDAALDDPRMPNAPAIYSPMLQQPDYLGYACAIVRTPGNPSQAGRALRERIEALGREYPLRIETVGDEMGRTLLPERLLALVTAFFGALGLLLAAVGLYGLLAYAVSQRIREIGVRAALGATSAAIERMFLRETALLLAIGLAAGLAVALWGGRALTALLYGLSGHDPATLAISAVVLTAVALMASLIPALRAARIDPADALRHE